MAVLVLLPGVAKSVRESLHYYKSVVKSQPRVDLTELGR